MMENDDSIEQFREIITRTVNNIRIKDINDSVGTIDKWKSVLLKIKSSSNPNEGQNLADHSRVVDFKNGVLLVEADHPGWISLLQMHKNFIIRGMNMGNSGLKVSTLAYRLKGMKGNLFDPEKNKYSSEAVREEIEKKAALEDKKLSEFNKDEGKITRNKELPPELASIFDDLHKNMLTNSKK